MTREQSERRRRERRPYLVRAPHECDKRRRGSACLSGNEEELRGPSSIFAPIINSTGETPWRRSFFPAFNQGGWAENKTCAGVAAEAPRVFIEATDGTRSSAGGFITSAAPEQLSAAKTSDNDPDCVIVMSSGLSLLWDLTCRTKSLQGAFTGMC